MLCNNIVYREIAVLHNTYLILNTHTQSMNLSAKQKESQLRHFGDPCQIPLWTT